MHNNIKKTLIYFLTNQFISDVDGEWTTHIEKVLLIKFLRARSFNSKKKLAITIIKKLFEPHRKGRAGDYIDILNLIEEILNYKNFRDHVCHAVNTYILGLYLYQLFFKEKITIKTDEITFKIAFLLHDVGYFYEAQANKTIQSSQYKRHKKQTKSFPPEEELLKDRKTSLRLTLYFKNMGLNYTAGALYDNNSNKHCHGILGGRLILKYIVELYEAKNPRKRIGEKTKIENTSFDWRNINKDILPACAAIYLHNLESRLFHTHKIVLNKSLISYLLRLCDTLQEWDRFSNTKPIYRQDDFNILISNDMIKYYTKIGNTKSPIEDGIDALIPNYTDIIVQSNN